MAHFIFIEGAKEKRKWHGRNERKAGNRTRGRAARLAE
jgi:hypothetical protein